MSINLHLEAQIDAISKVGRHRIRDTFGLRQTPTKITERILNSKNIKQEYITWVLENSYVEKIEIYAPEDVFEELEPIGYEERNYSEEHTKDLDKWLLDHEGWKIKWYSQ